jgi:predicted AAA+ superfamily ATPase
MDGKQLKEIILSQQREGSQEKGFVRRDVLEKMQELVDLPHVIVVTGIRRAGKSTLLKQIKETFYKDRLVYSINFDDDRLLSFTVDDFQLLHETFMELYGKSTVYFLDEVQNVVGWEAFVRRMNDAGYKFFITGSNASMLSKELGTRLTGRHVNVEIFPFSFKEFLACRKVQVPGTILPEDRAAIKQSFTKFLQKGGIPEYVLHDMAITVKMLYDNILYRDIIARYNITNEKSLRELALYLLSNPGTEISYNKLKEMLSLGSVNSIKDYIQYMENAYLFFTVYKYDASLKHQVYANKKVYAIDTGMIEAIAFKIPTFTGKVLENAIFVELKRRGKGVYFYKDKHECDFLIVEKNVVVGALQVTTTMAASKEREYKGLLAAMATYNLPEGLIITDEEEGTDVVDGKTIKVIPAWKWLLDIVG